MQWNLSSIGELITIVATVGSGVGVILFTLLKSKLQEQWKKDIFDVTDKMQSEFSKTLKKELDAMLVSVNQHTELLKNDHDNRAKLCGNIMESTKEELRKNIVDLKTAIERYHESLIATKMELSEHKAEIRNLKSRNRND